MGKLELKTNCAYFPISLKVDFAKGKDNPGSK